MANSVAFITGGASGLGESAARVLARNGYNVFLFDMNDERAIQVGKEIESDNPGVKTGYFVGDVTSEEDVKNAFDKAQQLGTLRAIVNSAGIGAAWKTVDSKGKPMDLAAFSRVLAINLTGTFNVSRIGASYLVQHSPKTSDNLRGVIINVASVAAFDGQIGQGLFYFFYF